MARGRGPSPWIWTENADKVRFWTETADMFGAPFAVNGIFQVCADLTDLHQAIMSLRAFEEFAPSVRMVTDWSGIDDVDSHRSARPKRSDESAYS